MSACHYCKQEEGTPIPDSTDVIELRPYGPDGSGVCFDCGTSPEHEEETMTNMLAIVMGIVKSGHTPVITDTGIESL